MKTNESDINRLFWWFRRNYGSRWVMLFNSADLLAAGKADWLKELKKFNITHIRKVLKIVKSVYPKKPPTLMQFSALATNQKNCKPGHGGNKLFITEPGIKENKAGGSVGKTYLDKIREESLS